MSIKFPTSDKMWGFIEDFNLSNYSASNLEFVLKVGVLTDWQRANLYKYGGIVQ